MAFTDNPDGRIILAGYLPVQITLSGTVRTGDLVGYNSGWKQADANNSIYAELVAGQHGSSGKKITCYRMARVGGITTGTAGNVLYLSDTTGEYSASAGTVSQRVGFELGNGEMLIEPKNIVLVRAEQVDWDDIEDATSGYVVLGNSSNRPTPTEITGDIGITNAGVTSISSGVIVDADVKSDAAIALSKLAPVTDGYIIVGNGSNVPTAVAMSGDVTIINDGTTTIGDGRVTEAMQKAINADGLHSHRIARATYDFSEHGGAQGTIGLGVTLPDNAVVTRSYYEVLTTLTSSTDAATIAIDIPTDDVGGIVAAVAISDAGNPWDAGYHEGIQDGTVANFSNKCTAARELSVTIATEDVTAGKFILWAEYVVSD